MGGDVEASHRRSARTRSRRRCRVSRAASRLGSRWRARNAPRPPTSCLLGGGRGVSSKQRRAKARVGVMSGGAGECEGKGEDEVTSAWEQGQLRGRLLCLTFLADK
eukprot:scaffold139224_cov93-Phaeocystis_antarctica.AAC.1